MRLRQLPALASIELWKAQAKIYQHDVSAPSGQVEDDAAQRIAQARQHRQRQPVQEPHRGDQQTAQHRLGQAQPAQSEMARKKTGSRIFMPWWIRQQ
jgi:hypothetical protein